MPSVLSKISSRCEEDTRVTCHICGAKLSCYRSLRRHRQTMHPNWAAFNQYTCESCCYMTNSITKLNTHMDIQHQCSHPKCCFYCNKFFVNPIAYLDHMHRAHELPVHNMADFQIDKESHLMPTERAFDGVLKIYDFDVGGYEVDLFSYMRSKQPDIDNLIQLNTQDGPRKLMFVARIRLIQPSKDQVVSSQPDAIVFYAATKQHKVDFGGLSNEEFMEMVEQMLRALASFSFHGSGWLVDCILSLEMRFAKIQPVTGSQFLQLPHELKDSCDGQCSLNRRWSIRARKFCF